MVVLLETTVSGQRADKVIKRLGFDQSHRVEAQGFLGAIWILYHEGVKVEVVRND